MQVAAKQSDNMSSCTSDGARRPLATRRLPDEEKTDYRRHCVARRMHKSRRGSLSLLSFRLKSQCFMDCLVDEMREISGSL